MPQMNPMFLLTSMMAFAFSLDDEDDEDYKPRVITKSVERTTPTDNTGGSKKAA